MIKIGMNQSWFIFLKMGEELTCPEHMAAHFDQIRKENKIGGKLFDRQY